jgi:hypothetical protein
VIYWIVPHHDLTFQSAITYAYLLLWKNNAISMKIIYEFLRQWNHIAVEKRKKNIIYKQAIAGS